MFARVMKRSGAPVPRDAQEKAPWRALVQGASPLPTSRGRKSSGGLGERRLPRSPDRVWPERPWRGRVPRRAIILARVAPTISRHP
jgi:hypothetical protein